MTGQQQSPINLKETVRVHRLADQLDIRWETGKQDFHVKKKAYGYRFAPHLETQAVHLDSEAYTLAEVHFHRPSEHWVDGRRYDAELHAVHVRVDDGVQRCAVGVFLTVAETDHDQPEPPDSFNRPHCCPKTSRSTGTKAHSPHRTTANASAGWS